MGSVAAMALATPAFALPDRYEQGYSCTGRGPICTQEQMGLFDDGNRFDEKAGNEDRSGSLSAARASDDDGDEVGDEISEAADEAGDEVENAADEVGDEVSEAADEAGDAIDDVFD
jgi:hypothetical protein